LYLCTFVPSYKNEASNLAPIEVEILLCRSRRLGTAQKIETDSGTSGLLKNKISAAEKKQQKPLNPCNFKPLQLKASAS